MIKINDLKLVFVDTEFPRTMRGGEGKYTNHGNSRGWKEHHESLWNRKTWGGGGWGVKLGHGYFLEVHTLAKIFV